MSTRRHRDDIWWFVKWLLLLAIWIVVVIALQGCNYDAAIEQDVDFMRPNTDVPARLRVGISGPIGPK